MGNTKAIHRTMNEVPYVYVLCGAQYTHQSVWINKTAGSGPMVGPERGKVYEKTEHDEDSVTHWKASWLTRFTEIDHD